MSVEEKYKGMYEDHWRRLKNKNWHWYHPVDIQMPKLSYGLLKAVCPDLNASQIHERLGETIEDITYEEIKLLPNAL